MRCFEHFVRHYAAFRRQSVLMKGLNMSNLKRVLYAVVMASTVCAVEASAQAISFDNTDASNIEFPSMDKAWLKGGAITDPMHPRSMGLGLTKNQVRSIISYPHFNETMFAVREWNYIFNFKKADGSYLTCQYQVQFDDNVRTKGLYWDREECLKFVQGKPVEQPPRSISLGADGLFAFGKSSYDDLLPAGRQKLQRLAEQVNKGYNLKSLEVVGHTDRIGSNASNMALSQARAQTVKNFLAGNGVSASVITARGVGSSQPIVTCAGSATPTVIACLQPNRRVDVAVNGSLKP